jgi:uncharacterized protein YneF (UPF0154 family)
MGYFFMKKCLMLVVLIVLLQSTLANDYYISAKQHKDNLLVNHIISLEEKQEISLVLPKHYENLQSTKEFIILEDTIIFNDKDITFSYIQPRSDSFGKLNYFLIRFETNVKISRFVLEFLSDENYAAKKELISPRGFELISYERINLLSWRFEEFNKGDFKIFLEKKSNYFMYFLVIIILLAIFLFFIVGFHFSKKRRNVEYLLEDEKIFIELLKKSNRRENWQRKLQEELGFSKAKLSRMVRNLESRGLIEKIPIGNTNKIVLK